MKKENTFLKSVCNIAIPVTLQAMLQNSFTMIDQVMIGQLGSVSIAAIGLAGKFSSIFNFLVSAVAAVAGIMIAQYMGKKDKDEVNRSLSVNLVVALGLTLLFMGLCLFGAGSIMGLYTEDEMTRQAAADYLKIMGWTFLPLALASLFATMLRCMEKAALPLYGSIAAALVNTGLNYVFIFGKFGFPAMGVEGAAIATVISQIANFLIIYAGFLFYDKKQEKGYRFSLDLEPSKIRQYIHMLLPLLLTEFLWCLGENVYTVIYGHIGTLDCAAMTLTNPIQGLIIGALGGLSQAAGILIGKTLGEKEFEKAYEDSKKLLWYGFVCSVLLSVVLVICSRWYVSIYQVEDQVKEIGIRLLMVFALMAPIKVQNMIVGSGIIRSGGKTKYLMWIDMIGTWGFGVPLGFLTAFVFHMSIPWVYFILSLEECVRLIMAYTVFRKKLWIQSLED